MAKWCAALVLLIAQTVLGTTAGQAQSSYPSRPVRVLCGFPAGTSSDIMARIFAQKLSEKFGQQFIVENRLGASGNLAAEAASKADADGYTLLLGTVANSISASVLKNLSHNFGTDFAPIAVVSSAPNILVVSNATGVSSVADFLKYAKGRSDLFFGSAGVGTAPHLSGELFNMMTGAKLTHVPYRGNSQGLLDLVSGRLNAVFAPAPTLAAFVKDDRVKALAVTSAKRSSHLPDLPTLAESGLPGFDTSIWYGFLAPKGTPPQILKLLADALVEAGESPDIKAQLARNGAEPLSITLDKFGAFVAEDIAKWRKVVEFAQIKG
ncbi:MAG: Bug family tripartite tricarboxylate transporter substrate binding protein [Xanthobacteraceae bacterium]